MLILMGSLVGLITRGPNATGPAQNSGPAGRRDTEPRTTPLEKDFGPAAYYCGLEVCRKALKAPSTAKFSSQYSDEHTGWSGWGYNPWKVFGYVDAQNSFGEGVAKVSATV